MGADYYDEPEKMLPEGLLLGIGKNWTIQGVIVVPYHRYEHFYQRSLRRIIFFNFRNKLPDRGKYLKFWRILKMFLHRTKLC